MTTCFMRRIKSFSGQTSNCNYLNNLVHRLISARHTPSAIWPIFKAGAWPQIGLGPAEHGVFYSVSDADNTLHFKSSGETPGKSRICWLTPFCHYDLER